MSIKNNIASITQTLPVGCKLIVVSKTQSVDRIQEAYNAGHRIFGENKAQELTTKFEGLPKDIEWHMIGHLQTNKVKYIAAFVHLIHSVDSLKLLQEINNQAEKNNRKIRCLLQVNIAQEDTKFGFSEPELMDLIQSGELQKLPHVEIIGLMGMATFTENINQVRKEFSGLKNLFERIKGMTSLPANLTMKELSIGMSNDYSIAVEEGSTLIRIGTAIFGERTIS